MSNHLLIGLGGTGCSVVREFKKLLFSEWRRKGGKGECPDIFEFKDRFSGREEQVRIATLSIDSHKDDLEGQHDKWRVLGEQLSLKDSERVLISPEGLANVKANLRDYPGIEPWIARERDQMDEILKGTDEPNGCNQIRRLGRLALSNGNNLPNVLNAFNNRRAELTKGGSLDVTLHITCTLGCGTGSGTIVDIIAQLRRVLSQETGKFPIHLYVFATSSNVGDVATGNFYANQYAALQELNALRLGLYQPWDIAAKNGAKRLTINDAFEVSFIVTNATESGQGLTLSEQVNSTAEFLFQNLVRLMGNRPKRLGDAHTMQDVAQYPTDEEGSDRSTRFGSFGVKRLAIPEKEIHEKLAFTFVQQGLLRILFDNWSGRDGEGFIGAPKEFSDDGFVEKRKGKWGITYDHLNWNIDHPVEADDPYPQFLDTWQQECEQLAAEVKARYPKDSGAWISEYDLEVEQFKRNGFRGKGLDAYFAVRSEPSALVTRARKLAEAVEQDLLQGMENLSEDYQANYFPAIIRRAKAHLEAHRIKFSEELKDLPDQLNEALQHRDLNRNELQNVGIISGWLGKAENIFGAYQKATQDYHYLETLRIAAEYAVRLIEQALPEFVRLEQRAERFVLILKKLQGEHGYLVANRILEAQGSDEATEEPVQEVVYYVNAKEVNESISNLRMDADKQKAHAQALVDALRQLRRANDGFERYVDLAPEGEDGKIAGKVLHTLQGVAFPNSRGAHDQRCLSDKRFVSILGQNIVEKLFKDYGGRVAGDLETRMRKLMDVAMPAVSFDGSAMPVGHHGVSSPIFGRTVFLPECASVEKAFQEELGRLLASMTGGGHGGRRIEVELKTVPEGRNSTELVFLSVAYFFPVRMMKAVQSLHHHHGERLKAGSGIEQATFQIYTESHLPVLPSLLRPDEADRRVEALPWVLLAEQAGLVHVPASKDGDEPTLKLGELNALGRLVDSIELTAVPCTERDRVTAQELEADDALRQAGIKVPLSVICLVQHYQTKFAMRELRSLQKRVNMKLAERRTPAAKDAIKGRLDSLLDLIFVARGREEDAVFRFFSQGVEEAKKIVDTLDRAP
jgi:hypothetical protein